MSRADAERAQASRLRLDVIRRAGWKCAICAFPVWQVLQAHHIRHVRTIAADPNAQLGDFDNLMALCPTCHAIAHHLAEVQYTPAFKATYTPAQVEMFRVLEKS